jgi:zinc protease
VRSRLRSLAILVFVPLLASAALALNVDVSAFTLSNGMQVVVIPDRRAPVVTHMVWYRVGSADEVSGQAGIAHFLEHLMFKGTRNNPPGTFDRVLREVGGEDNAFTSKDYTAYFQRVAKQHLGRMMELEADRMQNLLLTDAAVDPERQVVIEERRERTENDPASLLAEQLDATLYLAHPYRKPVIGWRAEIERLSRANAIDFYRQYYTPANAILVVSGDVAAEEVRTLAERHYGSLKNTTEVKPRERTPEPAPIASRRVTLRDARVNVPLLHRVYLAPSYATAKDREAAALDLLAEILGGGSTSMLYRDLVVERKIASYAAAYYTGEGFDSGTFGVYAAPVPGGDLAAVEAALDAALADVTKNGVSAESLTRAKNKVDADLVYALDSQVTLARVFGTALSTGITVDRILAYPETIQAVSADEVKAAAVKVLDLRRSVTGIMLPEAGAAPAGAAKAPAAAVPAGQVN